MADQPNLEDDAKNISKMPDETNNEPNIDMTNVADERKSENTENKGRQQSIEPSGTIVPPVPNRITFIENNAGKGLIIPPVHNYTINLMTLTYDEEKMLRNVMKKDDAFVEEINEKVRMLKNEILILRQEGLARRGEKNAAYTSSMCIRCSRNYGIWRTAVPLVPKGMICQRCKFRVCKTCSHKQANGLWLCTLCVRYREIQILTGSWVCMDASGLSGTELMKVSFGDMEFYRNEREERMKRRSTRQKQSVSFDAEKRVTQVSPLHSPRRSSRHSRRHSSKRTSKRKSEKPEEEGKKKEKKEKHKKDKKDKKGKKDNKGKKDKKGKKDDKKGKQKDKKKDDGKRKSKKGKGKGGKDKQAKDDKKHGKSKHGKKDKKKKSGKDKSKNADNKLANTNISRHSDAELERENPDIHDFQDSQVNAFASKSGLILQRQSRSHSRTRARTCDQHLRWQDESTATAFLGDSTRGPHDESIFVDASGHPTVLQKKSAHEHRNRKPSSLDVTEMGSGDHTYDQTRQARRHRHSHSHRTENYNHRTHKSRRRAHDLITSDCLLNEKKDSHNLQHNDKLFDERGHFPVEVIPSVSRINLLQTNSNDEELIGKKRVCIKNFQSEVFSAWSHFADEDICLRVSSGNSYKIPHNSDLDMQTVTVLQPSSNCHEETYTLNTEAPDGEWEKQCCELEDPTVDRLKGSCMSIFEPNNFGKELLSENETCVGAITLYTAAHDSQDSQDISKENCAPSFCDKSADLLAGEDHQIDQTSVLSIEANCTTSPNTSLVSPAKDGQKGRIVGRKNIVSSLKNSKIISSLRNSKIVSNLRNSSIFKGMTSKVPATEARPKERVVVRQKNISSLRNNKIVFSLRNNSIFKRMTSPLANIYDYNTSALRMRRFGRMKDRNENYKVHKIATYQEYQQPQSRQSMDMAQMMAGQEQQMAEQAGASGPMKTKPKFNLGEVLLKAKKQQMQQEDQEQKQMFQRQKMFQRQQSQQLESKKKRQLSAKRMHALNFSKESQTEKKRSLASKLCPFCKFSIELGVR